MADPLEIVDSERLRDAFGNRVRRVDLTLHPADSSTPLFDFLAETAERVLAAADGAATLESGDGSGLPARPGLTITAAGCGAINYLAAPAGPETAPFLEALERLANPSPVSDDTPAADRDALGGEAELLVFIASACPHCPQAVRAAISLAIDRRAITVSIVDAQLFPELAERHAARSVPMTIVDGRLSITGVVDATKLEQELVARGTPAYEARVLRAHVESGRIETAVRHLQSRTGCQSFVSEWRESTTSLRMGLLLAAETLLEEFPSMLDSAVSNLLPALESDDGALRGDTADLLGRIGHLSALPALTALLEDPIEDVAEIAAEAIEEITRRD